LEKDTNSSFTMKWYTNKAKGKVIDTE